MVDGLRQKLGILVFIKTAPVANNMTSITDLICIIEKRQYLYNKKRMRKYLAGGIGR